MVTCPLCLKTFSKLKTNSHVLPRWALSEIKTNGKNYLITPNGSKKNQKDFIADLVCEDCEKGFAVDDAVAAAVIRDQASLEKNYLDNDTGIEIHNAKYALGFIKFSLGILLRSHFYKKVINEGNLLGPYLNKVRMMYLGEEKHCKILICRDSTIKICSLPQVQKFGHCTTQEYALLGFRIAHFLKEKEHLGAHFEQVWVNESQLNIMIDNQKNSHWHRGLAARVQGRRTPKA